MKFKTLTGKLKDINITRYLVDWNAPQGSKFSKEVLDFLRPYWKHDVVLSELEVAGTKMRYDYVNVSKRIICESDGFQHDGYSAHFHQGSRNAYLAQIKRDLAKDRAAEINGFKMIRVKPSDLPLTKEFFKRQFDIDL